MYTKASSPRLRGDNAKLQLAVPSVKSSCCLVFYYHMYGSAMGTLNVFSGHNKIFTKSGNQGNYWKKVVRTVHSSDMVSLNLHHLRKMLRGLLIASDNDSAIDTYE